MNETLQNALAEIITSALQSAGAAKDFILAEMPDVVQQLLLWKAAESAAYCLLAVVLLVSITCYWRFVFVNRKSDWARKPAPYAERLSDGYQALLGGGAIEHPADSFPAKVWKTLSRIDVGDHIETKGDKVKLSYLSWTWAWATLMNHFPESSFQVGEKKTYPDGSVSVVVSVTVREASKGLTREMWLPVMDHMNKAICNPNARQESDSQMRCLVKCLALFGLGTDVYAKSDIPVGSVDDPLNDDQLDRVAGLVGKLDDKAADAFLKYMGVDELKDISKGQYKAALSALERKVRSAS